MDLSSRLIEVHRRNTSIGEREVWGFGPTEIYVREIESAQSSCNDLIGMIGG